LYSSFMSNPALEIQEKIGVLLSNTAIKYIMEGKSFSIADLPPDEQVFPDDVPKALQEGTRHLVTVAGNHTLQVQIKVCVDAWNADRKNHLAYHQLDDKYKTIRWRLLHNMVPEKAVKVSK
jgi:hypothetical protein